MVLLWGTVRRIFCRKENPDSLSYAVYYSCVDRSGSFFESGMADRRYTECSDGDSQSDRCIVIIAGDCGGNKEIYQQCG